MAHWTTKIYINDKEVKVDRKIARLIYVLNLNNLPTKFCCQGDKYNSGYIYFENNIDIDKALMHVRAYFPKSLCFIESIDPCIITIFHSKTALETEWQRHKYLTRLRSKI